MNGGSGYGTRALYDAYREGYVSKGRPARTQSSSGTSKQGLPGGGQRTSFQNRLSKPCSID
jgi:hypothetical protein